MRNGKDFASTHHLFDIKLLHSLATSTPHLFDQMRQITMITLLKGQHTINSMMKLSSMAKQFSLLFPSQFPLKALKANNLSSREGRGRGGLITMAIRFSYTNIIIPGGYHPEKTSSRASLCHNSKISPKVSVSSNTSGTDTKVFEDQALGVICFRDEKGEIVCEGFDEGPRFDQRSLARKKFDRNRVPNFLRMMMIQANEDAFY
ncbi:unnamed protein product [Musa banksii]